MPEPQATPMHVSHKGKVGLEGLIVDYAWEKIFIIQSNKDINGTNSSKI